MSITEFCSTAWTSNMFARFHRDGRIHSVLAVDFEDKTVTIVCDGKERTVHCECVTLVEGGGQ